MPLSLDDVQAINEALQNWRQGDLILDSDIAFVHIARLSKPLTNEAALLAAEAPQGEADSDLGVVTSSFPGFVLLSQTCDITRDCRDRPFVELAPLVPKPAEQVEEIRRLKRPAYACVPAVANRQLVADLERTFTVEKAVLAPLNRVLGLTTLEEATAFAEALSRKRSRFAFPGEFTKAIENLKKRFKKRTRQQTDEARHVTAIREIRVAAVPSWDADSVDLVFWFIKDQNPDPQNWPQYLAEWEALIDQTGRFKIGEPFHIVDIDDITAKDYLESQRLDFDDLSTR